jgi:hypothetical protein
MKRLRSATGALFDLSVKKPALFERAGKAAERSFEVLTDALDHGNDRDRYAGGDQAIFNGRRARFVFRKTRHKRFHGDLAPQIATCCLRRAKGLRTLAIETQNIGETFRAS